MGDTPTSLPIGQQVSLPGHFDVCVVLESARPLAKGFECRVRLPDGTLDEAVLSAEEAAALAGSSPDADAKVPLANADQLRLLVESARIRLAYTHDRHFAVSMSGIRTLPHQIEAVYLKMLPQPRLRFLLADDPGAGKTIMRDYAERGENDKLGLPSENGQAAPLVDMLHRALWLMEKRPAELAAFLSEAQPNREQLRLVAQALGGPALKGGEMGDISPTAELSALGKLTANWQSLIENAALTTGEREEKKVGQKQLI